MSTITPTFQNTISPTRLGRLAVRDIKSRLDARREILWNIGRLLLVAVFFAVFFSDLSTPNEYVPFAFVAILALATSALSTWLVLKNHLLPAFIIGSAYDLLAFVFTWTALMTLDASNIADSDGWLSMFPVLISLPYRLGTVFGMAGGVIILLWVGALHVVLLPSDAHALEHLIPRWGILLATLAITGVFNFTLTRRTEALVEQTNRAEFLKGQNEAKSEFIDTVSHELRTPITVVLTLIGRLLRSSREKLSEQEADQLQVAMRNADQLSELIADLLEVSRIERGTLAYNRSNFSLEGLLHEVVDNVQSVTGKRGQTINVAALNAESTVYSDRARLTQVLNNLLTNASKYGGDGSEISVRATIDPDGARVAVTNPAGDLKEEEAERIFEMFFRADNEQTRSTSGTGLGLHISRRIIKDLEGEISSEMTNGQITLSFSVPARAA